MSVRAAAAVVAAAGPAAEEDVGEELALLLLALLSTLEVEVGVEAILFNVGVGVLGDITDEWAPGMNMQ